MKSRLRRFAHRLVLLATMWKARKIIAVSNSTKRDILKKFHINQQKIVVTYGGVDERFKPETNNAIIDGIKARLKIIKPFIFFVGVWRSHKNIENLVSAFEILKKRFNIPHQLVLGGREDLHYTKIRETIDKSPFKNDIITPGFIDDADLPAIYGAADVFALPSFIEGFGLIAVEAQSCGCPVVSTNTSSMPEVLDDSALFFDPWDVDEMAEQIYKAISNADLRKKLIDTGLKNAKRFSWRECAEQTLRLYRETNY
jgi:glycosyltransferase involved in cell wall biosynthesis